MCFPCLKVRILELSKPTVSHLKHILIFILSHLLLWLGKPILIFHLVRDHETTSTGNDEEDFPRYDHEEEYRRLSASLLPVPVVYFCTESIKKHLPIMSYDNFLRRKPGKIGENDTVCIVCLNGIKASHEVRVPFNCCHVFHRECLDAWIDQGQGTCPLCRSKLLPTNNHDHRDQDHHDQDHHDQDHHDHDQMGYEGDPWRRERMIYLFGEEY